MGIPQVLILVVFAAGCGAATPPTAADDSRDSHEATWEAEPTHQGMHPSWDIDNDGINDCETDGSCDHTVDYSKPRENP